MIPLFEHPTSMLGGRAPNQILRPSLSRPGAPDTISPICTKVSSPAPGPVGRSSLKRAASAALCRIKTPGSAAEYIVRVPLLKAKARGRFALRQKTTQPREAVPHDSICSSVFGTPKHSDTSIQIRKGRYIALQDTWHACGRKQLALSNWQLAKRKSSASGHSTGRRGLVLIRN